MTKNEVKIKVVGKAPTTRRPSAKSSAPTTIPGMLKKAARKAAEEYLGPELAGAASNALSSRNYWNSGPFLQDAEAYLSSKGPQKKIDRTFNPVKAPVTETFQTLGPSRFTRGGKAQKETMLTGKGPTSIISERVSFCDSIGAAEVTVASDGTPHMGQPFYQSAVYYNHLSISPAQVSARLAGVSAAYGFYAFRELTFNYIPACATSEPGSIAFAVDDAVDYAGTVVSTGLNYAQVLEHNPACATPVYAPISWKYKFGGSKLWKTSYNSTVTLDFAEYIQAWLWGCMFNVGQTKVFGKIFVAGIIDFYVLEETEGYVSLQEKKLWDRYVFQQWIQFRESPNSELITFRDFDDRYRDSLIHRERLSVRKEKKPVVLFDPMRGEDEKKK